MTIEEFTDLKNRVESARRQADRAAGAAAQLKKRLKSEYGVDSLADAKKKLKQLEGDAAERKAEFQTALERIDHGKKE